MKPLDGEFALGCVIRDLQAYDPLIGVHEDYKLVGIYVGGDLSWYSAPDWVQLTAGDLDLIGKFLDSLLPN